MNWRLPPWLRPDQPLFYALERGLEAADPEAAASLLHLTEAHGAYLDLHGALYGVRRLPGEPDEAYRRRIVAEVRTPRSTEEALRQALVASFPGLEVRVLTLVGGGVVWLDGSRTLDGSWALGGGEEAYPVRLTGDCLLNGGFDLGGGRFYPREGGLSGLCALDGSWRLGVAYHPPHANRFLVDVGGAEVDLRGVFAVVERFRAAGCIPTLRASLEAVLPWAFRAEGYAALYQSPLLDGARLLNGTWTLEEEALGETPL